MKRPTAAIRLGVMLFFVLGLLSPIATSGAGAQELTCDDFTSTRAAQAVLDADPSLEDSLDPDGDGIACNHDEDDAGTDDDRSSRTDDEEDDADDRGSTSDNAYLADVQDELDYLGGTFDRFLEIDQELGETDDQAERSALVAEWNDIAADWVEYPDVAADLVAPRGFEDVEDAFLDLADMVGETGELWEEYWAIPANDPDEEDAFDAFNASFIAVQDELDFVQGVVEDADGGSSTTDPTPEATEEATEETTTGSDADIYLADIQDELDVISDEAAELADILDLQVAGDATQADAEIFTEIMALWSAYPDDVAADLIAPRGLEDIEDAYLDLADTMAETSLLWDDYLGAEVDSRAETRAFDALVDSVASVQDQVADLQDLVDEAGGGGSSTTDPEPTEESRGGSDDVDADTYLADVADQADEWDNSIARFNQVISSAGSLSDDDIDELTSIVSSWMSAPSVAASFDVPAGLDDVQIAFEDYADAMADLGLTFTLFLSTEANTPASEQALDDFQDALDAADLAYEDLQDELDAAS